MVEISIHTYFSQNNENCFELWGKNMQLCFIYVFISVVVTRSATIVSVFREIYYIIAILIENNKNYNISIMWSVL